jgi:integrase
MTELARILDAELVDEHEHLPAVPSGRTAADDQLGAAAWELIDASIPENTTRAYRRLLMGGEGMWAELAWVPWCRTEGRSSGIDGEPATAKNLAEWVAELASANVGPPTIEQAIAAVKRLHTEHDFEGQPSSFRARQVLDGYRKQGAAKEAHRASPLTVPALRAILKAPPPGPARAAHDALALVLGVTAMLRRSEAVAARLEHITVTARGLSLWIPKSKTDKRGVGATVVIPRGNDPLTDPVGIHARWLEVLAEQGHDTQAGPLLRSITTRGDRIRGRGHLREGALHPSGVAVDRLVKSSAERAGLGTAGWSGHSLRAGGATAAYLGGASIFSIMDQGRWSSADTVKKYIRLEDRWINNAAGAMGL